MEELKQAAETKIEAVVRNCQIALANIRRAAKDRLAVKENLMEAQEWLAYAKQDIETLEILVANEADKW